MDKGFWSPQNTGSMMIAQEVRKDMTKSKKVKHKLYTVYTMPNHEDILEWVNCVVKKHPYFLIMR